MQLEQIKVNKKFFKTYASVILFYSSQCIEINGENKFKMDIIWVRLIIVKFYII
jgi:hypothetical protein